MAKSAKSFSKFIGDSEDGKALLRSLEEITPKRSDETLPIQNLVHNAEDYTDGRWVTTDEGQHVFIKEGGGMSPGGPEGKTVAGSSSDDDWMVKEREKSQRAHEEWKAETAVLDQKRHTAIEGVIEKAVKEAGYDGKITLKDGSIRGGSYDSGFVGTTAATCDLDTGEITIDTSQCDSKEDAQSIINHEMMHGMFETVHRRFMTEQVGKEHGYVGETPTHDKLTEFFNEETKAQLTTEDGVTPYSKAFWEAHKEGKVPFHIALHETLAEINGTQGPRGMPISKLYQKLSSAIKDEYLKDKKPYNPKANDHYSRNAPTLVLDD